MGGGGLRGSIFTTLDSTFGGGRKLFLLTFMTCVTLASSCVLTDNLQYSSSPGLATRRRANSLWNMSSADLKIGRCSSSLKTMGEEIWYGKLATHTSKYGSSVLSTSPTIILRRFISGLFTKRKKKGGREARQSLENSKNFQIKELLKRTLEELSKSSQRSQKELSKNFMFVFLFTHVPANLF